MPGSIPGPGNENHTFWPRGEQFHKRCFNLKELTVTNFRMDNEVRTIFSGGLKYKFSSKFTEDKRILTASK